MKPKFVPNAHPTRYNSKPIRTNKGKRDKCGLALNLLKKKKKSNNKKIVTDCKNGIQFTYNKVIQIILYADDQLVIGKSEDNLQTILC
jgi:hypothetical protein